MVCIQMLPLPWLAMAAAAHAAPIFQTHTRQCQLLCLTTAVYSPTHPLTQTQQRSSHNQ